MKNSSKASTRTYFVLITIALIIHNLWRQTSTPTETTAASLAAQIDLLEDALPETLNDWKRTHFTPPADHDEALLGSGCYLHAWEYSQNGLNARASFDQIPKKGWHELSQCYRGNGWIVEDRRLLEPDEGEEFPWICVVVKLKSPMGVPATLVFSIFDQFGEPIDPATGAELSNELTAIFSRRTRRVSKNKYPNGRACLQCQLLVTGPNAEVLGAEQNDIVQLHLATRQRFKEVWLRSDSKATE